MDGFKLQSELKARRQFDPSNKQDLEELGYFIKNKKWKDGCPFYLEYPYVDIPIMCMTRYAEHML